MLWYSRLHMASSEFYQRKVVFEHAVMSAMQVLGRPDLRTPEQEYVSTFSDSIDNACMGVVDVPNGFIHVDGIPKANSVLIVPLTENDMRSVKPGMIFSYGEAMIKHGMISAEYQLSHMAKQQAECRLDDELVVPSIILTPKLRHRTSLQIGSTIVHEMDHGYWAHNKEKIWPHDNMDTLQAHAAMEVSAYSLEDAIMQANDPVLYGREKRAVEVKYGSSDFMTNVEFNHGIPLHRNMRSTAFLSLLFKHFGAKPLTYPSKELVDALIIQGIVSAAELGDIAEVKSSEPQPIITSLHTSSVSFGGM